MHYSVESVEGRTVCADSGTVQYYLKWEGYSSDVNSWEPRRNLVCCSNEVTLRDEREADATNQSIASFLRQHHEAPSHDQESMGTGRKRLRDESDGIRLVVDDAESPVMLRCGEIAVCPVERQMRSTIGGHSSHRNRHAIAPQATLVDVECSAEAAHAHERAWQNTYTESMFRLAMTSTCVAPIQCSNDASIKDGLDAHPQRLRVISLVPAWACRTWDASDHNVPRTLLEQSIPPLCSHRALLGELAVDLEDDELVVEYVVEDDDAQANECEKTWAMPLSIFRDARPQDLLDYLLAHSVLMTVAPNEVGIHNEL